MSGVIKIEILETVDELRELLKSTQVKRSQKEYKHYIG